MDHRRLVELVKQLPILWDRNCAAFRDKGAKDRAWEELGAKMGYEVNTCKDAFKFLREKYLREREKVQHQPDHHPAWNLMNDLKFLDPHILTRTTGFNLSNKEDEIQASPDSDPTDFDKHLIQMVKKASPIWDRNSNTYPNKTSKHQLWEQIASTLRRDVNTCMLRWKALREKYIRQKAKFQDGEAKWELLDDLVFLDKVIQYRRKQNEFNQTSSEPSTPGSSVHRIYRQKTEERTIGYQENSNYSYIHCNADTEDYPYTDSSNDFLHIVKEENAVQQVADSSFNSSGKRLRHNSVGSYGGDTASIEKRTKPDESSVGTSQDPDDNQRALVKEKTPEQLFGDLVASLLSKKPENQRNLYMIEIMTVLSK